jgi:hypothetical protein
MFQGGDIWMWQQLQCDYYVEFILTIIRHTISMLSAEAVDLKEFQARKSNIENAINTLQVLIATYKEDKLIPSEYLLLYRTLIDLKAFVKHLDADLNTKKKNKICSELILYSENIQSIHEHILQSTSK